MLLNHGDFTNTCTGQKKAEMKGYKQMSDAQRMRAFFLLKGMSENGQFPHGALAKVAKIFGMGRVDPLIMRQRAGRPSK